MARTWERENEKKLIIRLYRWSFVHAVICDIYKEIQFLFYFLLIHSGFEWAGVKIRENHTCIPLWIVKSRWWSLGFFVFICSHSLTHLANVYWGLGDPHLVRVDDFKLATASSLGARSSRQTLASGRELRESVEQRLLQVQGWGCADVASRRRLVWSLRASQPGRGGQCRGRERRLPRGAQGEAEGLLRSWGGGSALIHPPVCQHRLLLLLLSLVSRVRLRNPRDGSPPGSPVPGILQARTLEWVAISFSSAWKWKVKGKSLSRVRLLADPMDCSLPGSSVHGIFQVRVLEWSAFAFSEHLSRCWDNITSRHGDKALWGLHFNRGESGDKELNW